MARGVLAIKKGIIPPDHPIPTIREMIIMVARLGGYLNRKSDPEPGAKVIWRGLEYLRIFVDALDVALVLMNTQSKFSVKKSYG